MDSLPTPNEEQAKGLVRWFINAFGGAIAGWFAARGWFSIDDAMHIINSPALMGVATSAVVAIWTILTHTRKNAVAVVDKMAKDPTSPVAGVVTTNTPEGKALANSIPGTTTVQAGTNAATQLAK